jgi:hypothetical protein
VNLPKNQREVKFTDLPQQQPFGFVLLWELLLDVVGGS